MAKVIVLDAGHGLYTSGKQTMNGSSGIVKEWTLNNIVANYAKEYLNEYEDIKVYRTDDITGRTDVPLTTRIQRCNNYGADLFVSLHQNAGKLCQSM